MASLIYSGQALEDLERLTDFLLGTDVGAALETVSLIEEGVNILTLTR